MWPGADFFCSRLVILGTMPEIVQLGGIAGYQLDPLLLEETVEWSEKLDWDFGRSAELVRHFTDTKALAGAALVERGEVVGYGYAVLENDKALVGDLYVRPPWRVGNAESHLLGTILDALMQMPQVRRIESQLLMISPAVGEVAGRERGIRTCERVLMTVDATPVTIREASPRFRVERWGDHHQEMAATVIALAYGNHVDSRINEQYRTVSGARKFLANIIQYPGCGNFHAESSLVAFDNRTGWVAGMSLASFVGPETEHITQLCVTPQSQGSGLGRELLLRSMEALRQAGAKRITLTVTGANRGALELYRRTGFREMRRFLACIWDRNEASRASAAPNSP